jgi:hypothetical protein
MVTRPEVVVADATTSRADRDGASRLGMPTALQLRRPLDAIAALLLPGANNNNKSR